jgi:hypothetical protein
MRARPRAPAAAPTRAHRIGAADPADAPYEREFKGGNVRRGAL